ncbi:hypothetical protein D3C71_697350 [compost metagenome]
MASPAPGGYRTGHVRPARTAAAARPAGAAHGCRRAGRRLPCGCVRSRTAAPHRVRGPAGRWSARWPAAGRVRNAGRNAARRHRANTGTRPGPAAGAAAGTAGPGWIRSRIRIRCAHRTGPAAGNSAAARCPGRVRHPVAAAPRGRSGGPGFRVAGRRPRPACAGRSVPARSPHQRAGHYAPVAAAPVRRATAARRCQGHRAHWPARARHAGWGRRPGDGGSPVRAGRCAGVVRSSANRRTGHGWHRSPAPVHAENRG